MNKVYDILLEDKSVGTTALEKADAAMGVVFGEITFNDIDTPYEYIKSYCINHQIDFDDYPEEMVISTRTIPGLKVINSRGQEIKGLGVQISGMQSDLFELTIEGIPYPFYEDEFPHHVRAYEELSQRLQAQGKTASQNENSDSTADRHRISTDGTLLFT